MPRECFPADNGLYWAGAALIAAHKTDKMENGKAKQNVPTPLQRASLQQGGGLPLPLTLRLRLCFWIFIFGRFSLFFVFLLHLFIILYLIYMMTTFNAVNLQILNVIEFESIWSN